MPEFPISTYGAMGWMFDARKCSIARMYTEHFTLTPGTQDLNSDLKSASAFRRDLIQFEKEV